MHKYVMASLFVIITLVACTATQPQARTVPTRLPSLTVVPGETSTTTSDTSTVVSTPHTTATARNLDAYAGVSAEGYATLGDAQAPITFVDYSDFF